MIECDAARQLPSKCLFLRKQRETLGTFVPVYKSFDQILAKCRLGNYSPWQWANAFQPIASQRNSIVYHSWKSAEMFDLLREQSKPRSVLFFCSVKYLRIVRSNVPTDRDTIPDKESVVTLYSKGASSQWPVIISLPQSDNFHLSFMFVSADHGCSILDFFLGGKIHGVNLASKCQNDS